MRRSDYGRCPGVLRAAVLCAGYLAGVLTLCLSGVPAHAAATDVVSREVSVWNNPATSALGNWDALSREVSLWNDPRTTTLGFADTMSREVSLWNDVRLSVLGFPDAMTREVTVQAGPVVQQNAALALRGAGGLMTVSAADKTTLNVVTSDTSANRVDIRDAVRLVRKAAGLDP